MSTVKPQKPWVASRSDRVRDASIFLGSVVFSYLFVGFTPMNGKLAYFSVFFITLTAANGISGFVRYGLASAKDGALKTLVGFGAVVTIIPIASILATVIKNGYKGIQLNLFSQDMSLATPTDPLTNGGILHAISGTLILVAVALIMSVPLGILTALYLTELKGRGSTLIRFLVQAMSGIPSIVAGLFIYSALITGTGRGFSAFMGALALTILMIPTVARTSEEVLKLIPSDLREAGLALGATQWRTVAMVVIPAAKSGLITAAILGVARIAGETAPLLFTTGGADALNTNPVDGNIGSVPFYVWKALIDGSPNAIARAWAGIFLLMIIVLSLFILARKIGSPKKIRS